MHDDNRTVPLTLHSTELDHFHYVVLEEVNCCCDYLDDVKGGRAALGEKFDNGCHDDLRGVFDRLSIFSRYAAQLERGETRFVVADEELPAFKHALCSQILAEGELQSMASEAEEAGTLIGDATLEIVESKCRIDLVNSLADQVGGLI
jgi:hypothetical protein